MNLRAGTGTNTIRAVLWDNDGVLVDTESLFFEATRSVFDRAGLSLAKEMWGALYLGQGKSSKEIALAAGARPERIGQLIEERNRQYRLMLAQQPLRPRVRETLETLAGHVKMALVTDSHREQLYLMHGKNGLLGLFDQIVTGDDSPHAKPHPAPYLAALEALRVEPESCIAVEDSPKGLASARAAGVPCVVVPNELTRALDFEGALSIEQDVSRVLKCIGSGKAARPWS